MGLPGAPRFGPAEMVPETETEDKRQTRTLLYCTLHIQVYRYRKQNQTLTVVPCLLRPGSIGEELPERFSMELGCVHCDRRD